MSKTKSLIARLPIETHNALKAKLAQEGRSIQDFVEQAAKEYLEKDQDSSNDDHYF